MRILDEQNFGLLWNWGEPERQELSSRFQTNLVELLKAVKQAAASGQAMGPEDLSALAAELQEAGEALEACRSNCLTLAATLRALASNK